MTLKQLVQDRLLQCKERFILLTKKAKEPDLKKFGRDWAKLDLAPPYFAHLFLKIDSVRDKAIVRVEQVLWVRALNSFAEANRNFCAKRYTEALSYLFDVVDFLGAQEGITQERYRVSTQLADGKHKDEKLVIVEYYLKNTNLHEMSAYKAAELIESSGKTKLKHDAIYRFLLRYRKHADEIDSYIPKWDKSILDPKVYSFLSKKALSELADSVNRLIRQRAEKKIEELIYRSTK